MDLEQNSSGDEIDEDVPFLKVSETNSPYLKRRTLQNPNEILFPDRQANHPTKIKINLLNGK